MKDVIVAMSGGIDSATTLAIASKMRRKVLCVSVQYGAKADKWEKKASMEIAKFYKTPCRFLRFDLSVIYNNSFMQGSKDKMPLGELRPEDESGIRAITVPNRNLILLALLGGLALHEGFSEVWFGAHGDVHRFPDATDLFVSAASAATLAGTDQQVCVVAPLLFRCNTKEDVIKYAMEMQVPLHLTRACYEDSEQQCGNCVACVSRKASFSKLQLEDPSSYLV